MEFFTGWLFYALIACLLGIGGYFTLRFAGVQIRALPHSVAMLWKKADQEGISPFQALTVGLSTRVGTGNIIGIAVALTLGGPGAIFWMWVTALLGMSIAFVESTLAQIFKVPHKDRTFRGGPAYYIRMGLNSRLLSALFALAMIVTYGFVFNAVQANSIADAFQQTFGWERGLTGVALVLLSAPIVFGGIRYISRAMSVIVPAVACGYLMLATYVVGQHLSVLPEMISLIFKSAFGVRQAAGGLAGYAFAQALMTGVRRGLFSNEAGMGSTPNAAAIATVRHPVNQGLLQMLGAGLDTLVVCNATAFMILVSGQYVAGASMEGAALTQRALASAVGDWGGLFMTWAIFFFAWTTLIGNYAYAEGNILLLCRKKIVLALFRLALLGIIVVGSLSAAPQVWQMADISMAVMALINLFAVACLSKYALIAWKDYQAQRRAGIREPVFSRTSLPPECAGKLAAGIWDDKAAGATEGKSDAEKWPFGIDTARQMA
ncbi:Alanine/glycine/cation symporter [Candidatus Glomeribacter gigasporarum BEG34]|uniref:Alanine/glycine/cation symporter n=1 Tax=Candidatus Glomeribacter gigasporarum BEG34 TaxID=1070319 RepID=G2JB12_9BURK|nr:alanine/glycine:cation symporter family protein [Candidatus Glomeribacter gigasporarum]CCD29964.1 Alanine/glycine/cation symporter [Candidatus Glomeribacter gigasporarum BEG34]